MSKTIERKYTLLGVVTNVMVKGLELNPVPETFDWEYTYKHDDDINKAKVYDINIITKTKRYVCKIKPDVEPMVRQLLWDITKTIKG